MTVSIRVIWHFRKWNFLSFVTLWVVTLSAETAHVTQTWRGRQCPELKFSFSSTRNAYSFMLGKGLSCFVTAFFGVFRIEIRKPGFYWQSCVQTTVMCASQATGIWHVTRALTVAICDNYILAIRWLISGFETYYAVVNVTLHLLLGYRLSPHCLPYL